MKIILLAFLNLFLLNTILSSDQEVKFCTDSKGLLEVFSELSGNSTQFRVNFTLATRKNRDPINIAIDNWSANEKDLFDPLLKTYVIVHGYLSHGKKSWILELKEALLDLEPSNIIIVDWSDGVKLNYVTSVKNTISTADQIVEFFSKLRQKLDNVSISSSNIKWNQLHLIGHSLGAHISGQVAHKISKVLPGFYLLKRITGLDPAKPCFRVSTTPDKLRLDKDDADFIDIIHTQSSEKELTLGTEELIGHLDFFVNGGIEQPECTGLFTVKGSRMICSHQSSYKYFIESVKIMNKKLGDCKYWSFPWNGTSEGVRKINTLIVSNKKCEECPEMGIGASKNNKQGKFLVITGAKSPYCRYTKEDGIFVIKSILKMESLKNSSSTDIHGDLNDFFTEP